MPIRRRLSSPEHGIGHYGQPVANTISQLGLYLALGAAGLSMFMYSISRDEKSSLAKWIDSYRSESQKTWEYRNTLRSDIKEQAARDKHLFSTSQKDPGYELRTPEYVGFFFFHFLSLDPYCN